MPPPAATQAAARLWTKPTPPVPARDSYSSSVEITRTLWWQTRFTRGRVREWKGDHNSVTVQNRTHVCMNFFDHKDLGNHLLQLCPTVVKHPVYTHIWSRSQWPSSLRHELSSPTRGMNVCARLFCIYVVLCGANGLVTGWSPVQGVLSTV
jgi:hypothetical protein